MKFRINRFLSLVLMSFPALSATAAEYDWTTTTSNGWLGSTNGYGLTSSSNWNTTPTFNNSTTLNFLNSAGSITIAAPSGTTTVNKMVFDSGTSWRINSGAATINFAGTTPTIDVQTGIARLEFNPQGSAGITKTGAGTVQSNFQSVSSGFTGPLTISEGTWQALNNYALAEQKTVNILSGATLNMSTLALGSGSIVSNLSVARGYTLNIAGDGSGSGAIIGAANILNGFSGLKNLTLTANASIGGTGTYDIGWNSGTIDGGGNTLTKLGNGTIWMRGSASSIAYHVSEGTLVASDNNAALGGAQGAVSVATGATLASNGSRSFATPLTMASGSTLQNLSGTTAWSGNVSLGAGNGVTVTGGSGANTSISGVVSGASGTLIKAGANTLTLTNSNNYTGLTKVTQGTLALGSNGSIAASSEIQISNGATFNVSTVNGGYVLGSAQTLSGGGTVSGNVTIEGTHSPGFSPGIQTFTSDITYSGGSNLVWELTQNTAASASRGTLYDGINVQGDLTFGGATTLDLTFNLAGSSVDWTNGLWGGYLAGTNGWKVFDVAGTVNGLENLVLPSASTLLDSNGIALSAVRSQAFFYFSQLGTGVYLNYAVPEPTAAVFGGLGLLLLARRRRN